MIIWLLSRCVRLFSFFQFSLCSFIVQLRMTHPVILVLMILTAILSGVSSHKEDECIEVGFARASYLTVEQGYNAAKEEIIPIWIEEDKKNYPSYAHLSPQVKNVTRAATLLEATTKKIIGLIRKTRVGKRCREEWLLKGIEKHVSPLIQLDKDLATELGLVMSFRCLVGSPYPNVDGTCVNEEGPDMGAIGSKFLRLLQPDTGKGGFNLRGSTKEDKALPSARKVAQLIRRHMAKPAVTSLFTEMSHFVALDSVSIPESPFAEGINCCENPDSADCAPIFLEEKDPLYSTIKCFNFKRSAQAQAILGHRESLSMISTYLDATPVYGPTNEIAFQHKGGYFGYLNFPQSLDVDGQESKKSRPGCQFPTSFKGCFGLDDKDADFSENLKLLFTLEHNLIADTLAEINPHFDDSLLYNEARRILIAEYNSILYGEFVPILVGKELAEKHTLLPGSEGPGNKFIPEVNPGILTSHALVSYRNPSMVDEWHSKWGPTDFSSPLQFRSIREDPYQDFLAMDIQRGRDHGLVHYNAWRGFCDSGNHIGTWEELEAVFPKDLVRDLKELYDGELSDLDMMLALLEPPEEGAVVGKVLTCILVDQFARLRTGNRFYWEHDTSKLTHEQRDVIRTQSSAAALLCRHFGLDRVAKNAFLPVSESNPEVECNTLTKMDLTVWKDTSLIEVMQKKEDEEKEEKEREEKIIKESEETEKQQRMEQKSEEKMKAAKNEEKTKKINKEKSEL